MSDCAPSVLAPHAPTLSCKSARLEHLCGKKPFGAEG
jgi:hypothetical protein